MFRNIFLLSATGSNEKSPSNRDALYNRLIKSPSDIAPPTAKGTPVPRGMSKTKVPIVPGRVYDSIITTKAQTDTRISFFLACISAPLFYHC